MASDYFLFLRGDYLESLFPNCTSAKKRGLCPGVPVWQQWKNIWILPGSARSADKMACRTIDKQREGQMQENKSSLLFLNDDWLCGNIGRIPKIFRYSSRAIAM